VANLSAGGQVNPSLMLPALFALQRLACDRVQPGVDSAALPRSASVGITMFATCVWPVSASILSTATPDYTPSKTRL
jgi:hypothetical protein